MNKPIHPAEYIARHFLDFNFEVGMLAMEKVAIAANVGLNDKFIQCVMFVMDTVHYRRDWCQKRSFDNVTAGLRISPRLAWELERVIITDSTGKMYVSSITAEGILKVQMNYDLYPFHIAEIKLIKHREKLIKRTNKINA